MPPTEEPCVFHSGSIPFGAFPPELLSFFSPSAASAIASDHRPVIVDLLLPSSDCDGDGVPDAQEPDFDGDGAIDDCDNCPLANPGQGDANGDGTGDACEDFFCHPAFGTNTMQLSFCGDAYATQGHVIFGPQSAPGFIVVSASKLPFPVPLTPGPDDLLIFATVLVPHGPKPLRHAAPRPGPGRRGAELSRLERAGGGARPAHALDLRQQRGRGVGDPVGPACGCHPHKARRAGSGVAALTAFLARPTLESVMRGSPIECSDKVLGGAVVFKGTRVPVQTLIDCLEAGDRLDEFLADYPTVTREQAVAVLELAREALELNARAS